MTGRSLWPGVAIGVALATATAIAAPAPAPTDPRVGTAAAAVLGGSLGILLFLALARARPSLPRGDELTSAQLIFLLGWAWVEETVWRRLLLASFAVVGGVAIGLVVATALFAFAHRRGRATHLLTGAAFGGAFVATGRLGAAVASHAVYNLLVAGSRVHRKTL
jgi:membrane protease YdiL (CAAX protease family)